MWNVMKLAGLKIVWWFQRNFTLTVVENITYLIIFGFQNRTGQKNRTEFIDEWYKHNLYPNVSRGDKSKDHLKEGKVKVWIPTKWNFSIRWILIISKVIPNIMRETDFLTNRMISAIKIFEKLLFDFLYVSKICFFIR